MNSSLHGPVVQNIAPQLQPVGHELSRNSINLLAQRALSDKGIVCTLLFHSALHFDFVHRRSSTEPTLFYRGETIKLLNRRLESPEDAVSDSTIAMVGFLAASGVGLLRHECSGYRCGGADFNS
jgi:hypothetical protein